jgi:membrane protease subunit (stomatin/prohibitin family)
MNLIDVIKNDAIPGSKSVLIREFPGEDFHTKSQLIVAESEEAIFVKDGIAVATFEAGRHSLSTKNYPFIEKLINAFTGGVSVFHCKVYFVSKDHKLDLFWGTDTPIQMRDPVQRIQTSIQARGSYSIQVAESKKFLVKLIGNNVRSFTDETLNGYFRNAFLQIIKDSIAQHIKDSGQEILDICTDKTKIAESLKPKLAPTLDEYGVELVNFYVGDISIPAGDPNRAKLEDAFAEARRIEELAKADKFRKKTGAEADNDVIATLGPNWARQQSTEILHDLANNPGSGGVAAAGAAAGFGLAAGSVFGDMANHMFTDPPTASAALDPRPAAAQTAGSRFQTVGETTAVACAACGHPNAPGVKFCSECGALQPAVVKCPACGTDMAASAKFCPECGQKR